jgi:hypothetical protein
MAKSQTNTADSAEIKVTRKRSAPRAAKVEAEILVEEPSLLDGFVFMDKALELLNIGIKTEHNIVLYGPGGHGKSELALEFFHEKGIQPYVITMGTGMTTDRLFGGINLRKLDEEGMLEYLVENSFMNHEYVIFEELMDSPDFILEQLKDILSSGEFRNGSQVFPIKTRFIVGNTNKTRDEFSKNDSLKALMERFPMELNVIWPNYTDVAYLTLLEKRFGKGKVDPTIPFILQEYAKNSINISPRIAIAAYSVFETCGPSSLEYFADFSKKPKIISDALKKFSATVEFKKMGIEVEDLIAELKGTNEENKVDFLQSYGKLQTKVNEITKLSVTDDLAVPHANLISFSKKALSEFGTTASTYREMIKAKGQKAKTMSQESEDIVMSQLGDNSPAPDPSWIDEVSNLTLPKQAKKRKSPYQY